MFVLSVKDVVVDEEEVMKRCSDYAFSVWPLFVVAFITSVVTFVTWLTLSLSAFGLAEQIGVSAFVFVAVGGTLLHYVLGCMRRHRLASQTRS
ncbi:hypothetical protein ABC977_08275 [Thioalkalicoccus limnaeus]|uniref:Uncharacterized protein n=1 Tax=Thioalkalicoccus limnaeus TaxID=120681 RepID=A0ABV4BF16_9GAMM